jgi:hypothetical protein
VQSKVVGADELTYCDVSDGHEMRNLRSSTLLDDPDDPVEHLVEHGKLPFWVVEVASVSLRKYVVAWRTCSMAVRSRANCSSALPSRAQSA